MNGSVEVHEVAAPSLEGNPLGDATRRKTPVYLPPGYVGGKERFPVVYFLHGFTGSGMNWLNVSPYAPTPAERLDALIAAGTVPPLIAVYVDGWTAFGGSQWVNSEATGRYRDYLTRDVVGWVDRTFRTVPSAAARAVIGKSSGGYGAMVMGRHHPDLFGHIACHSGDSAFEYCYLVEFPKAAGAFLKTGGVEAWFKDFQRRVRETKMQGGDHASVDVIAMAAAYSPKKGAPLNLELPFEPETARLKPDVWGRWLANDPVRFIPQSRDAFRKLKSVFLDCGTRDEFNLQWGTRMMAQELRAAGIEVVHEEFEDGHMGIQYRYDRSLSYLGPRLARE